MKGVIFDFNGTLFPDTDKHRKAWTEFLSRRGMVLKEDDYRAHFLGPTNRQILEMIFKRKLSDEELERYAFEKEDLYRSFCRADRASLSLTKGAAELLDADPFAKVDVSRAPKAVAIGDNRELERVVASGDVDFTRQVETGTQRVTGDQAVYEVDKRELTITGKDDKRPRFYDSDATRNGVADRIVVDLATEKVHMNYSTIEFDPGKFN